MSIHVRVQADLYPENPREEFENLTTMWCAHRRYRLGDRELPNKPVTPEQIAERFGKLALIAPLYLYDHSGITISTRPFHCPWDSGQVGWVFVTEAKAKAEYRPSRAFPSRKKWLAQVVQAEVSTYDAYLRGEVYFYEVLDDRGEVLDSMGGIYGHEEAQRLADEALRAIQE